MSNITETDVLNSANAFWKNFSPRSVEDLDTLKRFHQSEMERAAGSPEIQEVAPLMMRVLNAWMVRNALTELGRLDNEVREKAETSNMGRAELERSLQEMRHHTQALASFLDRIFNPEAKPEFVSVSGRLTFKAMNAFMEKSAQYQPQKDGDFVDYALSILTPHLPQEYVKGLLKVETEAAGKHPASAEEYWTNFAPTGPLALDKCKTLVDNAKESELLSFLQGGMGETPAQQAARRESTEHRKKLNSAEDLLIETRTAFNLIIGQSAKIERAAADADVQEILGNEARRILGIAERGDLDQAVAQLHNVLTKIYNPGAKEEFRHEATQLAHAAAQTFVREATLGVVRQGALPEEDKPIAAEKCYMHALEQMLNQLPKAYVKGMVDTQLELYANLSGYSVREPGQPSYAKELQGTIDPQVKLGREQW